MVAVYGIGRDPSCGRGTCAAFNAHGEMADDGALEIRGRSRCGAGESESHVHEDLMWCEDCGVVYPHSPHGNGLGVRQSLKFVIAQCGARGVAVAGGVVAAPLYAVCRYRTGSLGSSECQQAAPKYQ